MGTPGDDRLDEKIFQGPIHQQVRDVLTYMKGYLVYKDSDIE